MKSHWYLALQCRTYRVHYSVFFPCKLLNWKPRTQLILKHVHFTIRTLGIHSHSIFTISFLWCFRMPVNSVIFSCENSNRPRIRLEQRGWKIAAKNKEMEWKKRWKEGRKKLHAKTWSDGRTRRIVEKEGVSNVKISRKWGQKKFDLVRKKIG